MKEWEEVESMDTFWGGALGTEEGNTLRREYSEVKDVSGIAYTHTQVRPYCAVLSKYSVTCGNVHGWNYT